MVTPVLGREAAHYLALEIWSRWEWDSLPCAALDELADALLAWAEDAELAPVVTRTVAEVFDDEFESDLRDCLEQLAGREPSLPEVQMALRDLSAKRGESAIVRALVEQCAYQYAHSRLPVFFCLCCLEEGLNKGAPRDIVLDVAQVAIRDIDFDSLEVARAIRASALDPRSIGRRLATDERRAVVQNRIARIAGFAARSLPNVASALSDAVATSRRATAQDDQLWSALCAALVDKSAAQHLN